MEINHKYSITADNLNVILTQKVKAESGVERIETLGYFFSCGEALKYLLDHEVKGSGLRDLATVTKKIAELRELIDRLAVSRLSLRDFQQEGEKTTPSNVFEGVTTENPINPTSQEGVTVIPQPVTDKTETKKCESCGGPMSESARSDARFCRAACRVKAHREHQSVMAV